MSDSRIYGYFIQYPFFILPLICNSCCHIDICFGLSPEQQFVYHSSIFMSHGKDIASCCDEEDTMETAKVFFYDDASLKNSLL
jgi:hypothetical protein